MYSLGLVSISFRQHTPEEIIPAVKAANLSCIEWGSDVHAPCADEARLHTIAQLQKESGITCCSYGTYFRLGVTPMEELPQYIQAARILGTDILRLWCGNRNPEDYSSEETAALIADCKAAAALAEVEQVTFCLECHMNTFTNDAHHALWLMEQVKSPRFRMYWQPHQFKTLEENLHYAGVIAPYTQNIHVFNWSGHEKYPLAQAVDLWRSYITQFPHQPTLLLEFMPDGKLDTLPRETTALMDIVRGEQK